MALYEVNLDEYESVETNWIAVYMYGDNVIYFDIQKEIKKIQPTKNMKTNIYRTQVYD